MRFNGKRIVGIVIVGVVLLMTSAFVWATWERGPRRPAEIPAGDYTYVTAVAEYQLESLMDKLHVPGMAAVLIDDQQVVWQGTFGYANLDEEIPVTQETVFKLWSVAKPFTAMEVMRLVEQEQLDLDLPLTGYMPTFTVQSRFPEAPAPTLRQLLTHRSGLPRNACIWPFDWQAGPQAVDELATAVADCYLIQPPGTRYKYSNLGFNILGTLVQAKHGTHFVTVMEEEWLQPLGMTHTAFHSTALPADSQLALGYAYHDGSFTPLEQADIGSLPASNLYSTAPDVTRFVQFIFRAGEVAGRQLISPETLSAMFTDQYSHPLDPQPMGLGWKLGSLPGGAQLAWHDGGPTEGNGALIAMLPEEKLGVILLGNATTLEGSSLLPVATELLSLMHETRDGEMPPSPAAVAAVALDPSLLSSYVGDYAIFGDLVRVFLSGDQLQMELYGFTVDLEPLDQQRFRIRHWVLDLGIDEVLPIPPGINEIVLEFHPTEELMIFNFSNNNFEICPRYPPLSPDDPWRAAAGRYGFHTSRQEPAVGESLITIEDDRLFMDGVVGPILPLDERTAVILSGSFQGETISRDPESGWLRHQGFWFEPLEDDEG